MSTLTGAAARVQQALAGQGLDCDIRSFPEGTRTAQDAAAAIGCSVDQIAKSLIFRLPESDEALLVVASGVNRVDEGKLERLLGQAVAKADAAFVRERTGYAIGGVPPVGHSQPPRILLDRDLKNHTEIWAAAGTPNAVFRLSPDVLAKLTEADYSDIRRD
ncbi:MAG: YbaK/EbsC family protein [Pseudomonadota bacterium]|uniref:YbaK/EbsC family protein n=1 Tax=Fodinicurvata fenggangensis TaxID=1121830 RepID=UPI00047CF3D2|nr:YbaK/EbsC family protein [Fodinicurvata fenggangensis]